MAARVPWEIFMAFPPPARSPLRGLPAAPSSLAGSAIG